MNDWERLPLAWEKIIFFLGQELAKPKDFSEETARIIDEEIQTIVREMELKALKTLTENRPQLDLLADALLEHETLEKQDVDNLLEINSNGQKARQLCY